MSIYSPKSFILHAKHVRYLSMLTDINNYFRSWNETRFEKDEEELKVIICTLDASKDEESPERIFEWQNTVDEAVNNISLHSGMCELVVTCKNIFLQFYLFILCFFNDVFNSSDYVPLNGRAISE
jgi:hypothetical protein